MDRTLAQKRALYVFGFVVLFVLSMAVWWIIYLARLTDEKVQIAIKLGADPSYVEELHQQEINQQIMLGSEGVIILLVILLGVWLIYRSVVQAERLRSHQENFLMAVTHELKTPLASMTVYLDTLESEKIPPEKKQKIVPRMRQDIFRLERLVDDILQAGRFDTSGYQPDRRRVDLEELLQKAAKATIRHNQTVEIDLQLDLESNLIARIDGPVVRRAVEAILDNSVKYATDEKPRIKINLRRRDRMAEISISDHGIGIEKAELKLIFDRFYRVGREMTRTSQGTGLGLYLCREMIRAHDGKVTVQSEGAGQGAQFFISLPMDGEK